MERGTKRATEIEKVKKGTKRAIEIKKVPKSKRAVTFTKRRNGLYSKSTELCLRHGGQVAILTTPASDNSDVSFYAFGHSSVDVVLSALLKKERPKEEFRRWWEDEALAKSEDRNEVKSAIDAMETMLKDVAALKLQLVEKQQKYHEEEETLRAFSEDDFVDLDEVFGTQTGEEEDDEFDVDKLLEESESLAMNLETEDDELLRVTE